jgi:hypothetical protein
LQLQLCSLFVWLVLICCERKVLLAGGWFVLREKYCWLVADKPNEQGVDRNHRKKLKGPARLY